MVEAGIYWIDILNEDALRAPTNKREYNKAVKKSQPLSIPVSMSTFCHLTSVMLVSLCVSETTDKHNPKWTLKLLMILRR